MFTAVSTQLTCLQPTASPFSVWKALLPVIHWTIPSPLTILFRPYLPSHAYADHCVEHCNLPPPHPPSWPAFSCLYFLPASKSQHKYLLCVLTIRMKNRWRQASLFCSLVFPTPTENWDPGRLWVSLIVPEPKMRLTRDVNCGQNPKIFPCSSTIQWQEGSEQLREPQAAKLFLVPAEPTNLLKSTISFPSYGSFRSIKDFPFPTNQSQILNLAFKTYYLTLKHFLVSNITWSPLSEMRSLGKTPFSWVNLPFVCLCLNLDDC